MTDPMAKDLGVRISATDRYLGRNMGNPLVGLVVISLNVSNCSRWSTEEKKNTEVEKKKQEIHEIFRKFTKFTKNITSR